MKLHLIFSPTVQYEEKSQDFFVDELSPNMLYVIETVIYPYHPEVIYTQDGDIHVIIDYPWDKIEELGEWIYNLSVDGNAPDTWMEADLSLEGYPNNYEFIPVLVEFHVKI